MEKMRIKGERLSHTYRMETSINPKVTLTNDEAEEYCAYKRQKKVAEIMLAFRRTESVLTTGDSAVKLCEQALRLRQAAVRLTPSELLYRGENFIKNGVKVDCIVGGNGETFPCVKAYEAKKSVKAGATEITLVWTPSLILNGRYAELKKELKRVRKAVKRITLKARVEREYPQAVLERLAHIASEQGAQYFSLPYFPGCEGLQASLSGGCLLEASGIDSLSLFKQTIGAGVGRIILSNAFDRYTEWLKEVEKITVQEEKSSSPLPPALPVVKQKEGEVTTSPALAVHPFRLDGSDLKFI